MWPRHRFRPDWVRPDDWEGVVVLCSGTSWDGAHLSDRHLAERLVRYAPVLFVDPPVSPLTSLRRPELRASVGPPRLTRIGHRLARLTPLAPPGVSRPVGRHLALLVTRAAMRRAVAQLGGAVEAVIVGSLDDLFGACGERQSVLWGTDDFASAGALMGLPQAWLERRQVDQLAKADLVIAVSDGLAEKWRPFGRPVFTVPNGCAAEHYERSADAPLPQDVRLPEPIATFVGHMSDRIDISLLARVAQDGHSLLLIGPRQATYRDRRFAELLELPNVQWVGPKRFDELPSYMRITRVGLTPYTDTPFNRASFPLKTLEYLAAGKPVVSTDLPATRSLDTDLITVAPSAEDFVTAVDRVLRTPMSATFESRAKSFAREHDWNSRTREIAGILGLHGR